MGMSIYDLVKKYGKGKGETVMWDATRMMSDALKPMKETDPDHYWHLVKQMYALMNGPHFDEDFGRWQISQMHFTDKAGKQHHDRCEIVYQWQIYIYPAQQTAGEQEECIVFKCVHKYCNIAQWIAQNKHQLCRRVSVAHSTWDFAVV